jgi:uncharacterized protein YjbI with pentapeptide repeats
MAKEGTLEWASEVLRRGAAGVEQWNQWRQQKKGFLDLSGIDLSHAQLIGVNLRGVKLWDAQFAGADLTRAQLAGAYLNRANLFGAKLIECNLGATNLRGAELRAAHLHGANLRYALNVTEEQLDSTHGVPSALPEGLPSKTIVQTVSSELTRATSVTR